jgi:ABC-type multidrug transport system fused ATPase/permease subunit
VQVLGNGIFLLGVILVMFALDWRIGLLMAGFAAVAVVVMTRTGGFVGARAKEARVAVGNLSGFLEERLGGMVDIKSNGGDAHAIHGLQHQMADRYTRTRTSILAASSFSAGVSLVFVVGTAAALALSAVLYRSGGLSLGTTFAVFRYTVMLRVPLEQLSRQMNSLQRASGATVRIRQLLDAQPAVVNGRGVKLGGAALGVEFDHVSFAYEAERTCRSRSRQEKSWGWPAGQDRERPPSQGYCSADTTRRQGQCGSAMSTFGRSASMTSGRGWQW